MSSFALGAILIGVAILQAAKEAYTSFTFDATGLSKEGRFIKTILAVFIPVAVALVEGIENPVDGEADYAIFGILGYISVALLIACNLAEEEYKRYTLLPVPWPLIIMLAVTVEGLAIAHWQVYGLTWGVFAFENVGFYILIAISSNFLFVVCLYHRSVGTLRYLEAVVNGALMLGLIAMLVKVLVFTDDQDLDPVLGQFSVGVTALAAGELNALIRFRKSRVVPIVDVDVYFAADTMHHDGLGTCL